MSNPIAAEICPAIRDPCLKTGFEDSAEGLRQVPWAVALRRDFDTSLRSSDDADDDIAPALPPTLGLRLIRMPTSTRRATRALTAGSTQRRTGQTTLRLAECPRADQWK